MYCSNQNCLTKRGSSIWLSFHVAARLIVQIAAYLQNVWQGSSNITEKYGMRLSTGKKLTLQHNMEEESKDIYWALVRSIKTGRNKLIKYFWRIGSIVVLYECSQLHNHTWVTNNCFHYQLRWRLFSSINWFVVKKKEPTVTISRNPKEHFQINNLILIIIIKKM